MVRSKEELLESIREQLGDDTSDNAISIIEDISDTLSDYETKVSDKTDWEQKYNENDAMWRKKYTDRFYNNSDNDDEQEEKTKEEEETKDIKTFDDLFEVKED